MSFRIHSYTEFGQQVRHEPPLWTRGLIFKRPTPLSVRIQQVVAVAALAALGFLFWLWLGISNNHSTRPSYPYYDTQGPVPPWSEPTPLEGNYKRK
jgi:hypothetical protein